MLLAIASQPVDTRSTFATGADVSRFQRSTVPAKPQDNDNAVQSTAGVPGGATVVAGPVVRVARGTADTAVPEEVSENERHQETPPLCRDRACRRIDAGGNFRRPGTACRRVSKDQRESGCEIGRAHA